MVSDWSERAVRSSDWNFFMALCGMEGKMSALSRGVIGREITLVIVPVISEFL